MHLIKPKGEDEMTEEQKKVMRTQDIGYMEMKRVAEAKVAAYSYYNIYICCLECCFVNVIKRSLCLQKIERLKSELHLLDANGKKKNKQVFFVETRKEGKLEPWSQFADYKLYVKFSRC